jgi:hypothetical protein
MLKEERTTCCVAGPLSFFDGRSEDFPRFPANAAKIQGATLLLLPDDHARLPRAFSPSLIFRRMGAALQITSSLLCPRAARGAYD